MYGNKRCGGNNDDGDGVEGRLGLLCSYFLAYPMVNRLLRWRGNGSVTATRDGIKNRWSYFFFVPNLPIFYSLLVKVYLFITVLVHERRTVAFAFSRIWTVRQIKVGCTCLL